MKFIITIVIAAETKISKDFTYEKSLQFQFSPNV